MDKNVGYSLFNPTPTDRYSPLMNIQYSGFAFVLSGLAWANRHKLADVLNPIRCWIKTKSNKPLIKTQKDALHDKKFIMKWTAIHENITQKQLSYCSDVLTTQAFPEK